MIGSLWRRSRFFNNDHAAHDGLMQFAKIIVKTWFVEGHFELLFYIGGVEFFVMHGGFSARYRVQKFLRFRPTHL
jgi:hypothetical protein